MKQQIKQALAPSGLNLSALIPVSALDQRWVDSLPDFGQLEPCRQTLLLIGNAGPAFWQACSQSENWSQRLKSHADPVDRAAVQAAQQALRAQLQPEQYQLLYPQLPDAAAIECEIPLQLLGEMAGWHQSSPLGIGMHAEYGLWFAYRVLLLLDLESPDFELRASPSACVSCETLECLQACPASALEMGKSPDLQRCLTYRLQEDSNCRDRCLARNACPVATGLRYTDEQNTYHYEVSLDSIRRWLNKN